MVQGRLPRFDNLLRQARSFLATAVGPLRRGVARINETLWDKCMLIPWGVDNAGYVAKTCPGERALGTEDTHMDWHAWTCLAVDIICLVRVDSSLLIHALAQTDKAN